MLKKESWVGNMILLICFLKHIIIMSSLKIKNQLYKNKKRFTTNVSTRGSLRRSKRRKKIKNINSKQTIN